ncbi:ceruloplasmin-like [Leptodactylus fuscus]
MKLLGTCLLCLWYIGNAVGEDRRYYFAIHERKWNYAYTGKNIISGKSIAEDEHAKIYLESGPTRIGKVYVKAMYSQYTNDSYTEEIMKPDWMGLMGPMITAEVGDKIILHLHNNATRPYSVHPHAVQYKKDGEGALYPDNTSGKQKKDDAVQPGQSYTYYWNVGEDQGPTAMDNDCLTRIYHSHVDSTKDVYSGLFGPLIICKKGTLNKKTKEKFFILIFVVLDENNSWYLDDNINKYCTDPASVNKQDPDFIESNLKHSINGHMFGNLPGLSMCNNEQITWHMFGVGNEADIHSVYFHNEVLTFQRHRVDTLNIFAATMIQATMSPEVPGKWLLSCQVNDHLEGGMQAIYEIKNCTGQSEKSCGFGSSVKHYYIAAEEIIWNYAPTSKNQFNGQILDDPKSESATYFTKNENRIGGSYMKARYVEYTDANFTTKKTRSKEEEHLGILGPTIWGEVGSTLLITFWNKASHPLSIQAHGVSTSKPMEGAVYKTGNVSEEQNGTSPASHVAPGEKFTYEWHIPYSVASTLNDLNCLPWLYYSSVDPVQDTNSGLVGTLMVCLNLASNKKNVAHDYFLMATVFDENKSLYIEKNIQLFTGKPQTVNKDDADFQNSNMMHSINGYMYGNLMGLKMWIGESVHWHILGIGNEADMHGIHFTGNTINIDGTTRDVVSVFPHTSFTATMIPDNAGTFDVDCLTSEHHRAGMRQRYTVQSRNTQTSTSYYRYVTYYIAAEEIEWDFSPNRTWEYLFYANQSGSPGDTYLNKTRTTLGKKYMKAVYREYTDGTFTVRKKRSKDQKHLGILGPLLKAYTGDRMKIIFKNNASRSYSMYAHGVKPQDNNIKPTKPGQVQTYIWNIPKRSGPSNKEIYCVTWAYYSNVDQVKDTCSGLIGPLVICKRNRYPWNSEWNVLRFALFFFIFNENESWYLDENIRKYSLNPDEVNKEDEDFIESNKLHCINGLMYGNLQGLEMHAGQYVNWHLIGMGSQVDVHTVHFHANNFIYTVVHYTLYDMQVFFGAVIVLLLTSLEQ